MQNPLKGNNTFEKNVNGPNRFPHRMSTSGFEYPNDLYNAQYPISLPLIPEARYQNFVPLNTLPTMNGENEKKYENTNQVFFSENNINLSNRGQFSTPTSNSFGSRLLHYDSNPIPRFSSAQQIGQVSSEHSHNQGNVNDHKPFSAMTYSQPILQPVIPNNTSNMYNNRQINTQMPWFLYYDVRTDTYQNVLWYPQGVPMIISGPEVNEVDINNYQKDGDVPSQEPFDIKEDYLSCQLNMTQQNSELDVFPEFVKNDLLYFLPQELPSSISEINRTESQSMPSLHGDDSEESDFETSDDDQLNTVYGEEMLIELQKMSSVFTNVVNLPMSRHTDVVGSSVFPCHNNLSRFKKTRIKERTTFWRVQRFIVKDNLVKIIPSEVLNIKPMDFGRMDKFEAEILECQLAKQTETPETPSARSDPPECIHSSYRCRSTPIDIRHLKHSNRANQKYRSSFNSHSHSPNDLNNYSSQQIPSNISSRHSHRKSMQIPLRRPVVWNPVIPLISPAVQQRNRMFFEPPNICNTKNPRKKRRWSVCGTKFDKSNVSNSVALHNLRPNGDFVNSNNKDVANEFLDIRHSPNLPRLDEYTSGRSSFICANIETKLDVQLRALKKTVMCCIESNMAEIRDEIKCLQSTHEHLENQLEYYKGKVNSLEESVRRNLPHEQWELFGVEDNYTVPR